MRRFLIFLAIFALIGMACAQWYPRSENYTTTGDINADNGIFTGDLTVAGLGSFTGGTVNSGVYDGNFRLAANHWLYSTTGTGGIDFSNGTGAFKSPTGINTFGGIGLFPSALYVVGTSALNYTTVTDLRASDDIYAAHLMALLTNLNATTVTTLYASSTANVAGTSALNYTTITDGRVADDLYAVHLMGLTSELNATSSTTNVVSGHSHLNQTYTAGLVDSGTSNLNATTTTTLTTSGLVQLGGSANIVENDLYLNNTDVGTGNTLAIVDADGLTVGGKIVPQSIPISIYIGSAPVDGTIWTAPYACKILSIKEAHSVAQNTAFPDTGSVTLYKAANGQNSGAGTALHNATVFLNSTVDTVVTPSLNAATGATTFAANQRVVANFNGTVTTLAGMGISLDIQRL